MAMNMNNIVITDIYFPTGRKDYQLKVFLGSDIY